MHKSKLSLLRKCKVNVDNVRKVREITKRSMIQPWLLSSHSTPRKYSMQPES